MVLMIIKEKLEFKTVIFLDKFTILLSNLRFLYFLLHFPLI